MSQDRSRAPHGRPPAADDAFAAFDPEVFCDPPARCRGWAMWEMDLTKVNTPQAAAQAVRGLADAGYGGFFIVATKASGRNLDPEYVRQGKQFFQLTEDGVEYLSEEFFAIYRAAVEEGKRLGLNVIFYDDYYFPTGQRLRPALHEAAAAHGQAPGHGGQGRHRAGQDRAAGPAAALTSARC